MSHISNPSFVNQYFDHVYVLNLKSREDRRIEMLRKLRHVGIRAEFVEAVNGRLFIHQWAHAKYESQGINVPGTHPIEDRLGQKAIHNPGAWACLMSYLHIWQDAKQRKFQRILCLEDDAVFHYDFENRFQEAIQGIPQDWKMLHIGATQRIWEVPQGLAYPDANKEAYDPEAPYYLARITTGTFALGLDASIFDLLIHEALKMKSPADVGPLWSVSEAYPDQCIVLQPNLIIADVSNSNIGGLKSQETEAERNKWKLENYDFSFNLQGSSPTEKCALADGFPTQKFTYHQSPNRVLTENKSIFFLISGKLEEKVGFSATEREINTSYKDYFKFAITQNPWSRLLSCYKTYIQAVDFQAEGFKDGVGEPLQRYGTFSGGMSFEAFVDAVCQISDAVAHPVFGSQLYQLLDEDGQLRVDYLGKVERLAEAIQEITDKTQLPDSLLTALVDTQGFDYQAYYTEELQEKVRERFSMDITFLNYDFEADPTPPKIGFIDEEWRRSFAPNQLLIHVLKEKNTRFSSQIRQMHFRIKFLVNLRQKLSQEGRRSTREKNRLVEALQQVEKEKEELLDINRKKYEALQAEYAALKQSWSWKMTAPLRKIVSLLKR